ncbi:alpha/beta fold hydrolase [Luteibacter sp. CQ10]|uniref:alpha/beta fold hydrolase n=1 Tax=Luteibacter sp. CQ10 TaxID=2805821 RepID=UPI0034A1F08B
MRRFALCLLTLALPAFADDTPTVQDLGARLERAEYPYPVTMFPVSSQGQSLEMAYMDVKPAKPNGRAVVLLHGKNFCGPYWKATADRLAGEGYRVVIPDQIGFCKSSKPRGYQYSIPQLAANTHALLASLGIDKVTVVAHSMGGMIGARYALMFPQGTEKLVMVDPLGLEDWKAKGVPWRSVDDWYRSELKTSYASIRAYQLKSYYDGKWKPEYDTWALMQAGQYEGSGRETSSWAGALTYDMIMNQPVVYEFAQIRVPTVLIIGQRDRTAVGKDAAPADVRETLGNYPVLGREAAAKIPRAKLIPLEGLGHSPMIEAPERFYKALDEAL